MTKWEEFCWVKYLFARKFPKISLFVFLSVVFGIPFTFRYSGFLILVWFALLAVLAANTIAFETIPKILEIDWIMDERGKLNG